MDLFLVILALFISILALIKSADLFSDFAEELALFFKIPPFIIGVTVVAFGTSLPELFSAIMAVIQEVPIIAIGNVIGENITNVFLVLGLATLFMPGKVIKISHDLIHVDLPFFVGSAFMGTMALLDGKIVLFESIILLLGLLLYLVYSISVRKDRVNDDVHKLLREEHPKIKPNLYSYLGGVTGLVGLILSAHFFVQAIVSFTTMLNVSLELVSATLIPFTSTLPELSVSIRNAIKGKSELVVGTILGSNIFNIFGVLGIAGLFGTLAADVSFLSLMLPVLVLATLLYFFITQDKTLTKWEGGLLVLGYFIYLQLIQGSLV